MVTLDQPTCVHEDREAYLSSTLTGRSSVTPINSSPYGRIPRFGCGPLCGCPISDLMYPGQVGRAPRTSRTRQAPVLRWRCILSSWWSRRPTAVGCGSGGDLTGSTAAGRHHDRRRRNPVEPRRRGRGIGTHHRTDHDVADAQCRHRVIAGDDVGAVARRARQRHGRRRAPTTRGSAVGRPRSAVEPVVFAAAAS